MSYFKKGSAVAKTEDKYVPKETTADVAKFPFMDIPDRGIRKETCERFGVRAGLSEKDGKTVDSYYFPSYSKKGVITGYMKQDITKPKEAEGHWTAVGTVSLGNKLFGQDVAESVGRKKSNLILTEGQLDCMSVYQSSVDSVKGSKFAGMEPFVVSIPLGTGNGVEAVLHNEECIKAFDSLTMFLDDDYCTPAETKKGIMKGHECREAIAGALVDSSLSLFTITPDFGFKDASDYLQAGKSAELAKLVAFGKKSYSAEKILMASDISLECLMKARPEGLYTNSFPKLMNKLHGWRPRELVLLCAPSGCGKSTTMSIIANEILDGLPENERVGFIFLEETAKETLQRIVASRLKVNYLKFKNSPLSCAPMEKIQQVYDSVVKNNRAVFLDHFGSLPISELMVKIKHMHLVSGCKYIFLDHLSVVISGSQVADERKEIDMVMTQLAAFCAANDVCVFCISHINRSGAEQEKVQKGKEDEPYWIHVNKSSLRGSASLEQLSFIVLGLEPQILPNRERGNVRLTVLKNRPWGYLGVADEFSVNEDTWEVQLHDDHVMGY